MMMRYSILQVAINKLVKRYCRTDVGSPMNNALAIATADSTVANITKPRFFLVNPRALNSVMQMVSLLRESANLVDIFAS